MSERFVAMLNMGKKIKMNTNERLNKTLFISLLQCGICAFLKKK